MDEPISVVELFAGVGGFRLGLENASSRFRTVWANQWEPSTPEQDAYKCYASHWGPDSCICEDIAKVKHLIPEHDVLVGGFPCQDYSIANKSGRGLEGRKGSLWWQIDSIVQTHHPQYILLENVDRLLWSPRHQFGRDFSVILRCLFDAGYIVEWRMINAAEYGQAQRRRRTFIFAARADLKLCIDLKNAVQTTGIKAMHSWIMHDGFMAKSFPVKDHKSSFVRGKLTHQAYPSVEDVFTSHHEYYKNAGVMIGGYYYSVDVLPVDIDPTTISSVLERNAVDPHFFIKDEDMAEWRYRKGPKHEPRKRRDGSTYYFDEGRVAFPEPLNKPSRTMLTSEGTLSRCTHVVPDYCTNKLRTLTPEECERLNGFPAGWTNTGMDESRRYFMMGNALVVPLITMMGKQLLHEINITQSKEC